MTSRHHPDPSFDQRVADWLEADPTRAPWEVLETVRAAIPSIPQRRRTWLPWRTSPMNRLLIAGAAVAAIVAVGLGSNLLALRDGPAPGVGASHSPFSPLPSGSPAGVAPSPTGVVPGLADYSTLPGRILVEHLGNALDLSEQDETDYNPDRRRFYFMDPADMTAATAVEFLPGQPSTGKSAADVSSDSRKVVFQDWTDKPSLYEANLDGTAFRRLPIECDCQLLYPDYDPTATKIVYTRIEGDESWLEIFDLDARTVTPLEATRGPADDNVPEQPAWSPNGSMIAFSRLTWAGRNDPVVGTVRYGDVPPVSGVLSVYDLENGTVTDVPLPDPTLPGDVNWYPDSRALLFSQSPASTTGSVANMPAGAVMRTPFDGAGLDTLAGWGGPKFLPDGSHILVQSNVLYLMKPDGSELRPVNSRAMDLSDLAQGFVYIAHWIAP